MRPLGKHESLNGLTVGTRLRNPGLRVVRLAHHVDSVELA